MTDLSTPHAAHRVRSGLPPVTEDPDTRGFFEAAAEGRLVVAECADCRRVIHLPTSFCPDCGRHSVSWREVAPRGVLHSWTVVEHQVHPDFPVPYTCILVDLDEVPGVRLLGHLDGRPELAIGMPMVAEFISVGGVTIPDWVPARG
ncbi:OB-fold domain-containing protein [Gordonia sp. GONU]|uniref:Zn-ribbon domain-containing OB-fold protein n=1 Tax=Gordonia TaxID=2053 RepID=UPI0004196E82|nr:MULTISPECIES: OB-fold domain-containing protein [Gordonia]MCR8899863.1 OB-fold domain-containing protein [Gordonia sp. GONU]MCZ4650573.1 OB-fold domain-containing protein [Gordonia amicalis]